MANFSITEAATAGFVLARRKPTAVIVWAGVGLLILVASIAAVVLMGGETLKAVAAAMQSGAVTEPEQAYALYRPLFPAYGVAFAISLVGYSIIMPAVYRAVLTPDVTSPGYIKVGPAELRQLVLVVFILALVTGIDLGLTWVLHAIAGATPAVNLIGGLAIFAIQIFLLVRLSLAGPDTLVKGRLSLAGSWRLSKDAGWRMFSVYAVTVLFQIMIAAALVIVMGVVLGVGAATASLGGAGTVIMLILTVLYLVATCLIYAVSIAVMTAPAAVIYRELSGRADA